ncbi:MAG: lamin tail domain-containing protein [bacterium]|nr:lamin tail domain-containing protein [bacterium]
MKYFIVLPFLFFAQTTSAAVLINEIQVAPINERFIELYNSDNSDVDLTGWYIQRKTATGSSFGSLVSSTQLMGKKLPAQSYFLISRSQLSNSNLVTDLTLTESNTIRIRDSKGNDVDQVMWGSLADGKSYQRTSGGQWTTASPTPGTANTTSQSTNSSPTVNTGESTKIGTNTNTAPTPTSPQISVKAVSQARIVLAGVPIIFEGRISASENSSAGKPRTVWSFGDGASAEGESVTHTYYYPGEYTAVIDVISGSTVATDRMLVRVVLPNISLRTGGDTARSFVTIQNNGGEELDLSLWQIISDTKTFILPKNTILGAHKSATFASEVTGLSTSAGNNPELLLPNGSRIDIKKNSVVETIPPQKITQAQTVKNIAPKVASQAVGSLQAAVAESVQDTPVPLKQEEGTLWPWYIGAAFLGALALVGFRLTQVTSPKTTFSADDFEILEETENSNENEKPH